MATKVVESDEDECSDSACDTTRVSFNVERSKRRSATRTESDRWRRSLQTCPVESNEEMLEGLLHHYRNNRSKTRIIEGLLFVLRQLLAPVCASVDTACRAWGFLTFDEAFGIFKSFFDHEVEKDQFQDHLLHPEYGLRVNVATVASKRYVVLENEFTDIGCFLNELILDEDEPSSTKRLKLTADVLECVLASMDTEYDRNALKGILFTFLSRSEIYALGVKPDRAVNFLSKTLQASQEVENAQLAAEDMIVLRINERKSKIQEKLDEIDKRLEKDGDLLSEKRKADMLQQKETLMERKEHAESVQKQETASAKKSFLQQRKRLASSLIEENRVKKRKRSCGAPSLLDSEDEEAIAKAIEDKSTAHGRRHDMVLYTNHRVKKKDFLSLANYFRLKQGKKLIKSATTVLNRARPRNVRSIAARSHKGKWLFCAKKPPKTENVENVCTKHQRKHVRNVKLSMFGGNNKGESLVISMDDKAYLRPGTDVGARDVKAVRIYDVADQSKQRVLPQHDFSVPQVHITPASFRFMTGHLETIDGRDCTVNDTDQTVVMVRPKYYIGSSGSVWASDYMFLRWELPQLFECSDQRYSRTSVHLRRLCAHARDVLYYFKDTTMHEDVMCLMDDPDHKFKDYEVKRIVWLRKHLTGAVCRWNEDKAAVEKGHEVALGNQLTDSLEAVLENLQNAENKALQGNANQLWTEYEATLSECEKSLQQIKSLNLPLVYSDILKTTDAGPGVGCSNVEVRFRDVEIARIHDSDRVNRVHRARDDSGQNEAERSNAAIGEALVDGSALKWKYHEPFASISPEEVDKLSAEEVKALEEKAMEQNAWHVARDVQSRIDDEPGPASDFMKAFITGGRDEHFFYNSEYLARFSACPESKKSGVPGHAYFNKISAFMKAHVQVGEIYLEYVKGICQRNEGVHCEFCAQTGCKNPNIQRAPRPYPNSRALPQLQFLPFNETPVFIDNEKTNYRPPDDFQPRAQLRKLFAAGEISPDEEGSIREFSEKYAVDQDLVVKYLHHLAYLQMMKEKREREKREKAEREKNLAYEDVEWEKLLCEDLLKKQRVSILNLYIEHHNLTKEKLTKKNKLDLVSAHMKLSALGSVSTAKDSNCSTSETSDDLESTKDSESEDCVLQEVGSDTSDEDNIPLSKLATNNLSDSDGDVPLSILRHII